MYFSYFYVDTTFVGSYNKVSRIFINIYRKKPKKHWEFIMPITIAQKELKPCVKCLNVNNFMVHNENLV